MTVPGHLHTHQQHSLVEILITVQGIKKAQAAASLERVHHVSEIIEIRHPDTIKSGQNSLADSLCFELSASIS